MSFNNLKIWPALPRTQRGQPIVLGNDPKGKKLLYAHGNSVLIVDTEDPSCSDVYTEHSTPVTVAKYSPSGFYICSGDQHGKVRIWDTINPEHILKAEYHCMGGPIRDIVWSHDSLRICVVGEGREKFAHVFMMDTGASVKGDLTGHTKCINTCDWKPTRPFRIATGGEDNKVAFYEGPPFQFKCTRGEHSKYVQAVRYAPNGEMFASGGFDGKVILYNGKDAEVLKELGSPAHKGGVYGVSWSPDSKQLLTTSADKSSKVWDAESGDLVATFTAGTEVEDQQVSCIWTPSGKLISVSLAGFLNFLDIENPGAPSKIVKGHNKPLTRILVTPDKEDLYSAATDGTVTVWDVATGTNTRVEGTGHGNKVSGLAYKDTQVYTVGIDDKLRAIDPTRKVYTSTVLSLGSQPRQIAPFTNGLVVVTIHEICIIENDKKVGSYPIQYEGESLDVSCGDEPYVAIGGNDSKLHVYKLSGNTLNEVKTLDHRGVVTDVKFSPDGDYVAACDSDRKVIIYRLEDFEKHNKIEWGFHNAKINCVAWSPDSQMVASGALDTSIILWSMKQTSKHIIIRNAHPQSQIVSLVFIDNDKFMSAGHDSLIKTWTAKF